MPPYGYVKNPNGKGWIVEESAAVVVRKIYDMAIQGYGLEQTAQYLEEEKIHTPVNYWKARGINRPTKAKSANPYAWNSSTVDGILSRQEYCGDVINFKTYSKSYKNKKRIQNDCENWAVFKGVHEAIVERELWERVQGKRKKTRKRQKSDGEVSIFSGLLKCADCGSNLNYHFNQSNHDIRYFNCSGYNQGRRKICPSTHYIRADFLEQIVFGEIKRLMKFVSIYEDEFVELVSKNSLVQAAEQRNKLQKELAAWKARDKELDTLFEKIYEDNVSGKISDERFGKLSVRYENEQNELAEKIKSTEEVLEKEESRAAEKDMFLRSVRKYTRAKKLTSAMVNELIEKIEVFQAEKINGERVQKLKIYYNCIGYVDIPVSDKIPGADVRIHTRKGVDIKYKK